jgi:hypothetical protein
MAEEYNEMDEFERMEAEAEELSNQAPTIKPKAPFRDTKLTGKMGRIREGNVRLNTPEGVRNIRQEERQEVKQVKEEPQIQQEEEKKIRYLAFHQPEIIGIYDNETGATVAQDFKDLGTAMGMAKIMNDTDTIITEGGFQ